MSELQQWWVTYIPSLLFALSKYTHSKNAPWDLSRAWPASILDQLTFQELFLMDSRTGIWAHCSLGCLECSPCHSPFVNHPNASFDREAFWILWKLPVNANRRWMKTRRKAWEMNACQQWFNILWLLATSYLALVKKYQLVLRHNSWNNAPYIFWLIDSGNEIFREPLYCGWSGRDGGLGHPGFYFIS